MLNVLLLLLSTFNLQSALYITFKEKSTFNNFFKNYILIRATHIINVGHDNTEQVHSFAVCYAM